MEQERHRKFITEKLYVVLMENAVKSDPISLSLLYEKYLKFDGSLDKLLKELGKGRPVGMIEDE